MEDSLPTLNGETRTVCPPKLSMKNTNETAQGGRRAQVQDQLVCFDSGSFSWRDFVRGDRAGRRRDEMELGSLCIDNETTINMNQV